MALDPGGLLAWLVVGLIAGFLASHFVRGHGLGLVGAIVGGLLFGVLLPGSSAGLIGSIVVACIGAALLLVLARAVAPRRGLGR